MDSDFPKDEILDSTGLLVLAKESVSGIVFVADKVACVLVDMSPGDGR